MSEVVVRVTLDSKGAVTGAQKTSRAVSEIGRDGERVAGTFQRVGTAIKTAFAFVFAGALARGLKDLAQKAFDLGTAVEETASKFSTVFGPAAARLDAELRKSANAMGLTQTEARGLTATVGAVVQGMNVGQEASAGYAAEILKLAGDITSFSNVQGGAEQVTQAVTSAIVGEREALKTLGIVILEEDVKQRQAQRAAEGHTDALTKQGKVAATLELITERAGVAVGDLERTQDSAANRARKFSAEMREQAEVIAQSLLPTFGYALDLVNDLTDGADGARDAFVRFVAEGVFEAVVEMARLLASVAETTKAILAATQAVGLFSEAGSLSGATLTFLQDVLKGATRFFHLFAHAGNLAKAVWNDFLALNAKAVNDDAGYRRYKAAANASIEAARENRRAIREAGTAQGEAATKAERWRAELDELIGSLGELSTGAQAMGPIVGDAFKTPAAEAEKLRKAAEGAGFALREMQVESMADTTKAEQIEKVKASVDLAFDQREAQLRERYADLGGLTEEMESALASARVSAMSAALDALVEVPEITMPSINFEQAISESREFELEIGRLKAEMKAGLVDSIKEADTALALLQQAFAAADTEQAREQIAALILEFDGLRSKMVALSDEEEFAAMMEGMNAVIEQGMEAMVGAFADGLGALAAGDADVQSIVGSIFGAFAGMLQRLGEIAIATGIGIKAIQTALASLNPLVAIGAGVALIALAATMRAAASNLASNSGGSSTSASASSGPSGSGRTTGRYATPGSSIPGNPSAGDGAAAQPQVKVEVEVKGESRIAGDDIRTVYNKASERYGVTRG